MKHFISIVSIAGMMIAGLASAQQNSAALKPAAAKPSTSDVKRTADGHPDLSGTFIYAIDLAPVALKKEVAGKVSVLTVDHTGNHPVKAPIPNALPFTPAPSYKPEFQAKVKDLIDHESRDRSGVLLRDARACRASDRRARSCNCRTR